jgi:hypothetical protein
VPASKLSSRKYRGRSSVLPGVVWSEVLLGVSGVIAILARLSPGGDFYLFPPRMNIQRMSRAATGPK